MSAFDLPGLVRRIRRTADLSQRELGRATGVSGTTIAAAEAGSRGLDARVLARLADTAGLRLALLDGEGHEVAPMDGGAVRDEGGRRYPAHLDVRHGDDGWWHGPHRYDRDPVTYTFDRDRRWRDLRRVRRGVPDDHQRPQPGDGLRDRAEARRRAALRAWRERVDEARAAAASRPDPVCTCPPACDDVFLDDRPPTPGRLRPHAPDCACGCSLD
ncbi:helix-turn-helix domain-containing protein [Geodermatophilus nigrescens]|uniref:Helix-turn-helix domain-containing protein n=1 Tax=Geodermatophilus nigrescens TaxID=1070870 RepID=A0A1M5DC19_9ACTN|nr:helix-turn-helix transcriptional regulator [Geodermatophilus nigrescens]SHF64573.1 Helix-turn-helix domain-containing protein [Geodermatophilus nigrescens]